MGGESNQTDTGRIAALLSDCGPREALPVLHRVAGVRRGGLPGLWFRAGRRLTTSEQAKHSLLVAPSVAPRERLY